MTDVAEVVGATSIEGFLVTRRCWPGCCRSDAWMSTVVL